MAKQTNKFHQGKYLVRNPDKYKGDVNAVYFRSGLERRYMMFLESCPLIVQWSSETVVVPYIFDIDKVTHRYFVDFWVKLQNGTEQLHELKPDRFCHPPRKNSKRYLIEAVEFVKNQNKWKFAEKFAKKNNMEFVVLTDKQIGTAFSDKKILENIRNSLKI